MRKEICFILAASFVLSACTGGLPALPDKKPADYSLVVSDVERSPNENRYKVTYKPVNTNPTPDSADRIPVYAAMSIETRDGVRTAGKVANYSVNSLGSQAKYFNLDNFDWYCNASLSINATVNPSGPKPVTEYIQLESGSEAQKEIDGNLYRFDYRDEGATIEQANGSSFRIEENQRFELPGAEGTFTLIQETSTASNALTRLKNKTFDPLEEQDRANNFESWSGNVRCEDTNISTPSFQIRPESTSVEVNESTTFSIETTDDVDNLRWKIYNFNEGLTLDETLGQRLNYTFARTGNWTVRARGDFEARKPSLTYEETLSDSVTVRVR